MATSLSPVRVNPNVWVDLYDATGISVGVKIIIQNVGSSPAQLTEAATVPPIPLGTTGVNIISDREYLTNATSAVGAWAFSKLGTTLQVEEA